MAIGSADLSKYYAMQGANSTVNTPVRVSAPTTGPRESGDLDTSAVLNLAAQNVQARTGATSVGPTIEAARAAEGNKYVGEQPQAASVSFGTINQLYGAQPTLNAANQYRNFDASRIYAGNSQNSGYGIYDALASYSNNPAKATTKVSGAESTSNPFKFTGSSSGFDYSGLSFSADKNLDPDKKMFIA